MWNIYILINVVIIDNIIMAIDKFPVCCTIEVKLYIISTQLTFGIKTRTRIMVVPTKNPVEKSAAYVLR